MFDLKKRRRGRAECKSMKNGPPEKKLHVFDVDLKSQIVTGQGHFLGEVPDLGHSGREHRIWNRTNLGSSPDLATSRVSGHKQFSASLHSLQPLPLQNETDINSLVRSFSGRNGIRLNLRAGLQEAFNGPCPRTLCPGVFSL